MAHIADFMIEKHANVGLNNYIARELSPSPQHDAVSVCHYGDSKSASAHTYFLQAPEVTVTQIQTEEKEKYVWRMHQPIEARKYQLFPAKDRLQLAAQKNSDTEMSQPLTMGATGNSDKAQTLLVAAARAKMVKEQTITRRRKVSVPELPTPMTTVQEVAMDSRECCGRDGSRIETKWFL
jgi:hypothetical protein